MEKQDMMYLAAGLILVLVIALVIKPMVTGHPVETGIAVATTTTLPVTVTHHQPVPVAPHIVSTAPTPLPTLPPTPVPTWNPAVTPTVIFVNSSTYGVSFNPSSPGGTQFANIAPDTTLTTFTTIASDTGSSGTTSVMYIPFPYWELWYTVNPYGEITPASQQVASTGGDQPSYSGIVGSYSSVKPQFTIKVMDGSDPNRIVRTISPPGGIDLDLWKGVKPTSDANAPKKYLTEPTFVPSTDPRPWVEKFFEGQRNYYFIITAQALQSYSIQIRVPTRYIGKY